MTRNPSRFLVLPVLLLTAAGLFGCDGGPSSSTPPVDDVTLDYGGSFDGEEIVLERFVSTTPYGPLAIELVALDVSVDPENDFVDLSVALRNDSNQSIAGPARVFVGDFVPADARVTNSDNQLVDPPIDEEVRPNGPYPDYFDYDATFGEDGILGPGETSQPRQWRVEVEGAGSFSFGAALVFSLDPERAYLSGWVFFDENLNGSYDDNEMPFGLGQVVLMGEAGRIASTRVLENGAWRIPVDDAGLFSVHWFPPPTLTAAPFAPLCPTTPNPREVVIVRGNDGRLRSLGDVNFGVVNGPCPPQPNDDVVRLTDESPDSIQTDDFALIDARVIASPGAPNGETTWFVEVTVGFSGCGPEHPFAAYAGDDFMDTNPPSTWLRLQHDDRDELCEAWFEETRVFDLTPLVRNYQRIYGDDVGPNFTMELSGPRGQSFQLSVP